jgi:hypothetical protein
MTPHTSDAATGGRVPARTYEVSYRENISDAARRAQARILVEHERRAARNTFIQVQVAKAVDAAEAEVSFHIAAGTLRDGGLDAEGFRARYLG